MKTSYLSQQLAEYISPTNPAIQAIVESLSEKLAQGHTCKRLTVEEKNTLAGFSSDALVIEGDLLYLKRYADYEQNLAQNLLRLAGESSTTLSEPLDRYFTDEHQKAAAELALSKQLAIITGGPGTGKTTTVVKILALLLKAQPSLRIALAAPTGKAAARLSWSIANSLSNTAVMQGFSDEIINKIPTQANTLHRLLGARPLSAEFQRNHANPLLEEVIVVDEASMIDLAMMSKLVESLKPSAKLILLGDKDQLASVESGAVLADCYQSLRHNRVELTHTYRFKGPIKDLATAVNQQEVAQVLTLFPKSTEDGSIEWKKDLKAIQAVIAQNMQAYLDVVNNIKQEEYIVKCFEQFSAFQMLCAMREGKTGVEAMNYLAEKSFAGQEKQGVWYAGRPVMITRNDSNTGLSNGDIGLCLPSPKPEDNHKLRVFFQQGQEIQDFLPARLPSHETAFAITIHKSQGSEFAHVMIVLPDADEQKNQGGTGLLSKELLYTAITRARKQVSIFSSETTLTNTIAYKVERESGLAQRLITT